MSNVIGKYAKFNRIQNIITTQYKTLNMKLLIFLDGTHKIFDYKLTNLLTNSQIFFFLIVTKILFFPCLINNAFIKSFTLIINIIIKFIFINKSFNRF